MYLGIFLLVMLLNACGQPSQAPCSGQNNKCSNVTGSISTQPNDVIQAIMNRRSIRKYRPLAIEKEKLDHLFKRFYRTDESRNDSDSYGLGLAIAKNIADKHNARIWMESADGKNICKVIF